MHKSIIIAGVGGQGTLLASKILSAAAEKRGLFVRTSETIGMAQRGGSVCSHLRIGAEDVSPVIPSAHADVLIGFELAEAARQIPKLKKSALCVVNTDTIIPTNVALKKGKYLAEDIYVGVQQGAKQGSTAFVIQLELTPRANLEVRTEQQSTKGGLTWKYNY